MSRQAFVQKEIWKHKSVRIFSCSYAGKKIWVKQAEPVRNVSWLRFARRACLFFGLGILQPSADPDGRRALRFETGRLRRLSARGIRVPEVFAAGDEWLALADCGDNLIDVLGDADLPVQAAQTILSSAAENLAALHALGIHHGRPALKDMVWDGQEDPLLDFEDGIIVGLSREKRILRDLLIFMQSIFKEMGNDGPLLAAGAFAVYARIQPHYAIRARAYFGRFNLLLLVLQIGLRYTGRDLESVYQTLHFFRK